MQNSLKILKRFLLSFAVMVMLNSNSYAIPVPVIAPDQLIIQIQQTGTSIQDTQSSIMDIATNAQTNAVMGQGETSIGGATDDAEQSQKDKDKAKKRAERKKKRAEKLKKMKEKAKKAKEKAEKAKRAAEQGQAEYAKGKKAYETGDVSALDLQRQENVDDEEGTKRKIFGTPEGADGTSVGEGSDGGSQNGVVGNERKFDRKLYKAEKKNIKAEKKLNKSEANYYEAKKDWNSSNAADSRKAKRKFKRAERQHERAKKKNEKAKKKLNQAEDELGFNTYNINVIEEISFASGEDDGDGELDGCVVAKTLVDLGFEKDMLEADEEIAGFMDEKFIKSKESAESGDLTNIIQQYKTVLKSDASCAYGLSTTYKVEASEYQERIEEFNKDKEGAVADVMSKLNMVDKEILDAFSRLVEIESSNLKLNSLKTLGVL